MQPDLEEAGLTKILRHSNPWITVGGIISLGLFLASCGGPSPPPTLTPTPIPTPEVMEKPTPMPVSLAPTPTSTPTAVVMEHPTPEAMAEEPALTSEAMAEEPALTSEAMVKECTPLPEAMVEASTFQEVALIERPGSFFPRRIVVLKDIPVRLYLTRLYREHDNRFSILPWVTSTASILPGEIGVIEFTPDQTGTFSILNLGHGWAATLTVVENTEEAKKSITETGTQEIALIHSIEDFRIFPDRLVVQNGIPVTIHNISLTAEHRVSIEPFYVPEEINVRPGEISTFEFTPDRTGVFTICDEIHGFTGKLVVK